VYQPIINHLVYARKIKSAQETQQTQENYASKNKSTQAQVTQLICKASGPCARKRNDRIDSIFHATHALALRALRAFEWKPSFTSTLQSYFLQLRCMPGIYSITGM